MERLVTISDLERFPQLVSQGVSLNMYYDFDALEAANEVPPIAENLDATKEATKPIPKKKDIKTTHKVKPAKQKAKSK